MKKEIFLEPSVKYSDILNNHLKNYDEQNFNKIIRIKV